jgi:hypothetical protein
MICPIALRRGRCDFLNAPAQPKHDARPCPLRCRFLTELLFQASRETLGIGFLVFGRGRVREHGGKGSQFPANSGSRPRLLAYRHLRRPVIESTAAGPPQSNTKPFCFVTNRERPRSRDHPVGTAEPRDWDKLRHWLRPRLRQRIDLLVGRKAAELLFRELQLAVHGDVKDSSPRSLIGDLGTELLEPRSRTESARLVVSLHAICDDDLHGGLGLGPAKRDSYASATRASRRCSPPALPPQAGFAPCGRRSIPSVES